MFSFSCCISSTKAVIVKDISNIEQTIPIIEKEKPVLDVSNVQSSVQSRNILYYFKVLKEPEEKEVSKSRLEDSKSEFHDSDTDEDEICVMLEDKPAEYSQPRIITPMQDESREPVNTPVPLV
jgi:acetolactate synthase small subunit